MGSPFHSFPCSLFFYFNKKIGYHNHSASYFSFKWLQQVTDRESLPISLFQYLLILNNARSISRTILKCICENTNYSYVPAINTKPATHTHVCEYSHTSSDHVHLLNQKFLFTPFFLPTETSIGALTNLTLTKCASTNPTHKFFSL